MKEGKWIRFVYIDSTPKTHKWGVLAKEDETYLGHVAWFGRWRGYAFFPSSDMVFEKTCLRDIADFIEAQNILHREHKR